MGTWKTVLVEVREQLLELVYPFNNSVLGLNLSFHICVAIAFLS